MKNKNVNMDDEWNSRVLCSDGNCIGVIGPDGHCKECGKLYEGDEKIHQGEKVEQKTEHTDSEEKATEEFDQTIPDVPDEDMEIDDEGVITDDTDENTSFYDDWENRTLCSDGNCIGIIGPDGRCKECGKPYKG